MIDVAVIGGGPAGAAAGIACARAGLHVVVLERSATDEEGTGPVESVGPDCLALLRRLDVDFGPAAVPFAGIILGSEFRIFGSVPVGLAGAHLERSRLDAALRRAAVQHGVELRTGVGVSALEADRVISLRTGAGPVSSRVVIDASGRHLILARHLGIGRRRLSPPLIAWRDTIASSRTSPGALARFIPHANGWTWLAETDRLTRVQLSIARAGSPKLNVGATAHVVSWHLVRRLAGPGWLIAGEAGLALDPAYGSGIQTALRSGLMAAAAAAVMIANPDLAALIAARYHDALSREGENGAATLASHYRRLGIRLTLNQLSHNMGNITNARNGASFGKA